MKVLLGRRARDVVTGFAGTATAEMRDSSDRVSYLIEAPCGTVDGHPRPGEARWFPEERIDALEDDDSVTIERDARELAALATDLKNELETLHDLLDATVCTCTLAKRCPQHTPTRPERRT